ncbi:zona pellucida sperm-binding protein 3-like [Mauremys mutica]|uniref:zona pellucida sperm-binding protein 3-like n=1 Tax=Mauremys mutica TaxID=74926 RepID=UPI001D1629C1|nr:zona pellucida sperm-binding protein 3-like [Mauremys mutica]XP_044881558.1 zona pellucida sperm-binding protein 3-like [Mauremys mutica]
MSAVLHTHPGAAPPKGAGRDGEEKQCEQKAIKPTWIPFRSMLSAEERLGFSLHLMNAGHLWKAPGISVAAVRLGTVGHLEDRRLTHLHRPWKRDVPSSHVKQHLLSGMLRLIVWWDLFPSLMQINTPGIFQKT